MVMGTKTQEQTGNQHLESTVVSEQTSEQPVQTMPVIYCGPSLPNGLLNQYTVYTEKLPEYLKPYMAKCPAIMSLVVPVDQLHAVSNDVIKKGTAAHTWAVEVQSFIQGGVTL